MSNALDGGSGGSYAPLLELDVGGLGFGRTLPASGTSSGFAWDAFAQDTADDGTSAARTHRRVRDLAPGATFVSGWTISNSSALRATLTGGGTTAAAEIPLNDILADGETITSLTVRFSIALGHAGLPANQPKINFVVHNITGTNTAVAFAQLAAGSQAQYENGGSSQTITISVGLTTLIDKTNNTYVLLVTDEWGTNAQAGNKYTNVLTIGHITAHRPF